MDTSREKADQSQASLPPELPSNSGKTPREKIPTIRLIFGALLIGAFAGHIFNSFAPPSPMATPSVPASTSSQLPQNPSHSLSTTQVPSATGPLPDGWTIKDAPKPPPSTEPVVGSTTSVQAALQRDNAISSDNRYVANVGSSTLNIPTPKGFISPKGLWPDLEMYDNSNIPPDFRLIVAFHPRRMVIDRNVAENTHKRMVTITIDKTIENQIITSSRFLNAANEFKKSAAESNQTNFVRQSTDALGKDSTPNIPSFKTIAQIVDNKNAVGVISLIQMTDSSSNKKQISMILTATILMHVRGKLLSVYVTTMYVDKNDLSWLRDTSLDLTNRILEANP